MNKRNQKLSNQLDKKSTPIQQMYYSKAQSILLKAYGDKNDFLQRMGELLSSIEKRKVFKILQQVKSKNKIFKKYLNEKRITSIKIEDLIEFEELSPKQNRISNVMGSEDNKKFNWSLLSYNSSFKNSIGKNFMNTQSRTIYFSQQSLQMIKKGFMGFLQKLEHQRKQQFINKTKYLQSILEKEFQKHKSYGTDYKEAGVKMHERKYQNKLTVVEELQKQEKVYGLYPIIMKNVRDQTFALENVINNFQNLMKY